MKCNGNTKRNGFCAPNNTSAGPPLCASHLSQNEQQKDKTQLAARRHAAAAAAAAALPGLPRAVYVADEQGKDTARR